MHKLPELIEKAKELPDADKSLYKLISKLHCGYQMAKNICTELHYPERQKTDLRRPNHKPTPSKFNPSKKC